jgi:peptidoglycan/xylan/chitin deacetylase (PgdA/CDA1 family)
LQGQKGLPDSACLLTFDDGLLDHYLNVFPVLRARRLSGLFFILDRCENKGLALAHKIHFLLARLGLTGLQEAIWENLNPSQREHFTQAERRYQSKYPPVSLDGRTNLLKAILQRDLSTDVDPLLGNLFEAHIGSENEIARDYYLNSERIREMAEGGMHFGGHSQSHPWFDWIDAGTRSAEIKASASRLQKIEPGPWAFAYPYGGLFDESAQLLQAYGFSAAFTTRAQIRHTDPYLIGRLDGEEAAQIGRSYA